MPSGKKFPFRHLKLLIVRKASKMLIKALLNIPASMAAHNKKTWLKTNFRCLPEGLWNRLSKIHLANSHFLGARGRSHRKQGVRGRMPRRSAEPKAYHVGAECAKSHYFIALKLGR